MEAEALDSDIIQVVEVEIIIAIMIMAHPVKDDSEMAITTGSTQLVEATIKAGCKETIKVEDVVALALDNSNHMRYGVFFQWHFVANNALKVFPFRVFTTMLLVKAIELPHWSNAKLTLVDDILH